MSPPETALPTAILGRTTWRVATANGYTATVTWTLYRPIQATSPPALPFTGRTTLGCQVSSSDALLLSTVVVKNTTASFPNRIQVLEGGPSFPADHNVRTDIDGVCGDPQTGPKEFFSKVFDIPPGGTVADDFWYVLDSYYSPAHPDGDTGALKSLVSDENGLGQGIAGMGGNADQQVNVLGCVSTPRAVAGLCP